MHKFFEKIEPNHQSVQIEILDGPSVFLEKNFWKMFSKFSGVCLYSGKCYMFVCLTFWKNRVLHAVCYLLRWEHKMT